jgi:hypothetical protein
MVEYSAIILMVNRCDCLKHNLFLGMINRLFVLQKVIVGVGANVAFTQ